MPYHIRLEQFEGPMSLLLKLIEEDKLDITRVSLAHVTDQYIEHIDKRQSVSLENLADFLSVAAKLILIKSKALLPLLEFSEEEEQEILDLEHHLIAYKKFKDISKELSVLYSSSSKAYSRGGYLGVQAVFYPPEKLTAQDLEGAFLRVLGDIPIAEILEEEMVREVLTLEEKIQHVHDMVRRKVETSFAEVVANAQDKVEIVVSFLALLELIKQQIIHAEQGELFSEIKMKHKDENPSSQESVSS